MPQAHWTEPIIARATAELQSAKEAMTAAMIRPVLRQPNIRDQVTQAIANPQALPADSRARLASMLYAKYGEQARNVLPYITGEQAPGEGDQSQVLTTPPPGAM